VHSASSGKFVLVTVHSKRGKDGMDAAGVLPSFAGIACHDAWAPYDCYQDAAGHALCNAHLLRELTAVTETGTADDVIWARQAIDALLALKDAADGAGTAGHPVIDAEIPGETPPLVPRCGCRGHHTERCPPQHAAEEAPRPGHPDGRPCR
jgi:transposase